MRLVITHIIINPQWEIGEEMTVEEEAVKKILDLMNNEYDIKEVYGDAFLNQKKKRSLPMATISVQ